MATISNRMAYARTRSSRRGIIVPLFAVTLPALLVLCCIALNIAQFRMLRAELKIAADATAHAGGRAMSVYQDVDKTIEFAQRIGRMNGVGNKPFELDKSQIVFGRSTRANAQSRYQFKPYETAAVRNRSVIPNSLGVKASGYYPVLLAAIGGRKDIQLRENSVATQVDRDIMLVLDKSGSMMYYKDVPALETALYNLYKLGKIKKTEYNDAKDNITFSSNTAKYLTGDMQAYAQDRRSSSTIAPRHSRWSQLKQGVDAFFDVVQRTDQTELTGLVTFSTTASLAQTLDANYSKIKSTVNATKPSGNTAIGLGLQSAVPELFTSSRARPFATKTIVVLTDGQNTTSPNPVTVAQDIMKKYNVTIHTVTFSAGSDVSDMGKVAAIGGGKHFHSDTGESLVPIFQEIANNLPTLLTQ